MYNSLSLGGWRPVVHRQPRGTRQVGLTFDDGPHPATTPAVLDLLKQHRCTATFFFTGVRAALHGDLVARTVAEGHAVYGHGWDHVNLEHASDGAILAAMASAEACLQRFRPTPDIYLVRLPYNAGARRRRVHAVVKRFHRDARFAWWSLTTRDWLLARDCQETEELNRRCAVLARNLEKQALLPGSLILMHEAPFGAEGELSARVAPLLLAEILAALQRRGLAAGPIHLAARPAAYERFFRWHPGGDRPIGGDDLVMTKWRRILN